jgi:hypothetical protein
VGSWAYVPSFCIVSAVGSTLPCSILYSDWGAFPINADYGKHSFRCGSVPCTAPAAGQGTCGPLCCAAIVPRVPLNLKVNSFFEARPVSAFRHTHNCLCQCSFQKVTSHGTNAFATAAKTYPIRGGDAHSSYTFILSIPR